MIEKTGNLTKNEGKKLYSHPNVFHIEHKSPCFSSHHNSNEFLNDNLLLKPSYTEYAESVTVVKASERTFINCHTVAWKNFFILLTKS